MESTTVFPTAPFDPQAQAAADAPSARAGTGENLDSPGKSKTAVLSRVKQKARKLKDKIKKVTGSKTASAENNEHGKRDINATSSPTGEDVDDEAESDEDEGDDDNHAKPYKNQGNYERLRSIGALDSEGDGSEAAVHGGVPPVAGVADTRGTYWKSADDSAPISQFKSAGPPDTLQATPTEYRNYAADSDRSLEGKAASSVPHGLPQDSSRDLGKEVNPQGSPSLPEVETSKNDIFDAAPTSGIAAPHPEGVSPYSMPGGGSSSEKYDKNNFSERDPKMEDGFNFKLAEPYPKHGNLDSNSYSDEPAKPSPSYEASIRDQIGVPSEDLSADRRLGVGLSYPENATSGERNLPDTSVPEMDSSNTSFNDSVGHHSKHGSSDTVPATGRDVTYPDDLVKPNPSFGRSSSPTYDKIGVMNENVSPDSKLGAGLLDEEHSGSGKGNLLDTSVPEFEELGGYRDSASGPMGADELVYKPISDPEAISSRELPTGSSDKLNAGERSFGSGQSLDNSANQFLGTSDRGLDSTRSGEIDRLLSENQFQGISGKALDSTRSGEIDRLPSENERGITSLNTTTHSDQNQNSDIPTEQPAGDTGHESWGKWSADKINNAKEVTVSDLIGTDFKNEIGTKSPNRKENELNSADEVVGTAHAEPVSVDNDALSKPRGLEHDSSKNVEEEYYDPNDVNDTKFQEGFTYGSGQEDVLSGTLAGSAIDKLQGAKATVQSSLGYPTQADSDAAVNEQSDLEGEERRLSPATPQEQEGRLKDGNENYFVGEEGKALPPANPQEQKDRLKDGQEEHFEGEERRALSPADFQEQKGGLRDGEEEYYDPNDVNDSKFQEGFTSGIGEDDVLSGTLAGSAIDKLQGLKATVQSSLGYSNRDDSDTNLQEGQGLEGEEKVLSPTTHQQQRDLKETVPSSFGYGTTLSDDDGYKNDVSEKDQRTESDVENSQQQSGGAYQVLKTAVASTFGYAKGENSPTAAKKSESWEVATNSPYLEPSYSDEVTRKEEYSPTAAKESGQSGGTYQVLKNAVASTLGYAKGEDSPTAARDVATDPPHLETPYNDKVTQKGEHSPTAERDVATDSPHLETPYNDEVTQKGEHSPTAAEESEQSGGTYQLLKNAVASTLGFAKGENSPAAAKESESRQVAADFANFEPLYDDEVSGKGEYSPTAAKESEQSGGIYKVLKSTVPSSLGYGKGEDSPNAAKESELPTPAKESEAREGAATAYLEPSYDDEVSGKGENSPTAAKESEQSGGIFKVLNNIAPSSLGYAKGENSPNAAKERELPTPGKESELRGGAATAYLEPSYDDEVTRKGEYSPTAAKESEQSRGIYKGLKNAVPSTLGYAKGEDSPIPVKGSELREVAADSPYLDPACDEVTQKGENLPIASKESESREVGADAADLEPSYDEDKEYGNEKKSGFGMNDGKENANTGGEVSSQQRSGGVLQGVWDMVSPRLGYNNQSEKQASTNTDHSEVGVDHQPSSYAQKFFNTTAAARDFLSAKAGYGNSQEEKGEGNLEEGEKIDV